MRRGWRSTFLALGLTALVVAVDAWLVTTVAGARLLLALLEWQSWPPDLDEVRKAQAIVVVTGQPSRIHQAARLHIATGVPLALVGKGGSERGFEVESEEMEDTLLRRYGIGPTWVETESLNTRENAAFAWCLLSSFDVRRIVLVTHTYHMPRARRQFEAAGFDVIPSPVPDTTGVVRMPPLTAAGFLPSRAGLRAARLPVREWGGVLFGTVGQVLYPPRRCPYTASDRSGS